MGGACGGKKKQGLRLEGLRTVDKVGTLEACLVPGAQPNHGTPDQPLNRQFTRSLPHICSLASGVGWCSGMGDTGHKKATRGDGRLHVVAAFLDDAHATFLELPIPGEDGGPIPVLAPCGPHVTLCWRK